MQALELWKAVTMDGSGLLDRIVALLDQHGIRYCVIGGQAVNAYAEPLISLDGAASQQTSERQDLADIARLIETHPRLRSSVPSAVLDRLE